MKIILYSLVGALAMFIFFVFLVAVVATAPDAAANREHASALLSTVGEAEGAGRDDGVSPIPFKGSTVYVERIPPKEWKLVSRDPMMLNWVNREHMIDCSLMAMSKDSPTAMVMCKDTRGMMVDSFPTHVAWAEGG